MNGIPTDVIKIITDYVGVNTNFKHEYVLCNIRGQSRVIANIIINNINHKIYARTTECLNWLLTHPSYKIGCNIDGEVDIKLLKQVYTLSRNFQEIESINNYIAKLKNIIHQNTQSRNNYFIFRYNAIKWVYGKQHLNFVPVEYKRDPYKSIIEVNLYDILIKM